MQTITDKGQSTIARTTGFALLALIAVGVASALLLSSGIDVNQTADFEQTAINMLDSELQLRGHAYLSVLLFAIEAVIAVGLFLLLLRHGPLLSGWSLFVSFAAATVSLLGVVSAMNAANIVGASEILDITTDDARLRLLWSEVASDYTSFHLGLLLSAVGKAGFYFLFLRSGLIPRPIAGWGLFASVFVGTILVSRDFVPALGADSITMAFIFSNLIAQLATGAYLAILGVRSEVRGV